MEDWIRGNQLQNFRILELLPLTKLLLFLSCNTSKRKFKNTQRHLNIIKKWYIQVSLYIEIGGDKGEKESESVRKTQREIDRPLDRQTNRQRQKKQR